ncbi:MAG: hypothetical protein MUD16_01225 [Desulfobacterales bacterium]|jgi:hypothetical protein|nr:hypothetical protein [Desulfobacterales bacterium]
MLDVSTAYQRYRFLGDEFLTWLWFCIEKDQKLFTAADADCTALEIGNRMVLENRKTKSVERITIKGDDAGLEEGRLALRKGALVSEMALVFKTGEYQWQFSVKGESLNISNLKTPGATAPQGPEQLEPFLLERFDFINKIIFFIENLYKLFIRARLSSQWVSKQVPSIRKWIEAADG